MTNAPINEALEEREGTIIIELRNNTGIGASVPGVPVFPENTLRQIVENYGNDLRINPKDDKIIFTNKRTGQEASNMDTTVAGLELQDGDVLFVKDNAGNA